MSTLPKAILLMGPTASGKTGVAMALTHRYPVELISVDSAQVFRDMNIGTAKPDAETLKAYPHHLIDLISPEEAYSTARFRADALAVMADISARGRIPLLVGGTMLYFKTLLQGLAELPQACPTTRAEIDTLAATHGWPAVHAELAKVDPTTAARLHPTDAQRVQRALEVYRLAGRPMSALLAEGTEQKPAFDFVSIGLLPSDRSVLHARIAERYDAMLKAGLEDEVTMLRQKYTLSLDLPSMRCVGYRQAWHYLDGDIDRQQLIDQGIAATRQLAKRQLTWLRGMEGLVEVDCLLEGEAVLERVLGAWERMMVE